MSSNIVFISNKLNLDLGGSNHSLDIMARHLSESGYSVKIKTMNVRKENKYPDNVPYTVEPIQETRGEQSVPKVAKSVYNTLKKEEQWADLFHCFFTPAVPVCGLYRLRLGKVPTVGRMNNYLMFCTNISEMGNECYLNCTARKKMKHDDKEKYQDKITNIPMYLARTYGVPRLASQNDRLFAISPQVKDIHAKNGVDQDTIQVIPNSLDPEYEGALEVENRNFTSVGTNKIFDVLYVGRIAREKGVDLLIDAAVDIDDDQFQFHIVGDGPQLSDLEQIVAAQDSATKIQFHGRVPHEDLSEFYLHSNLFVHPGRWPEPFGRTVLEAIQHGCPVLASDVGAPPWIAGSSGTTFTSESQTNLVEKLLELKRSTDDLESMSNNSKDEVDRFSREEIMKDIEQTYEGVLNN